MNQCKKCRADCNGTWCEDCYYPGIDEDYEEFRALLADGHCYIDAAVRSGWRGAEEFSIDAED